MNARKIIRLPKTDVIPTIIYKTIRIITIAPIIAGIAFLLIWRYNYGVFGSYKSLISCLFFVVLLPILSYPLQKVIPTYKKEGRKGQRDLAIIISMISAAIGLWWATVNEFSNGSKLIISSYLLASIFIYLFSKYTAINASGHACGITGPIIYLLFFIGQWAWLGLLVLIVVYWSSIKMKRHTLDELLYGSFCALIAFILAYYIYL